MRVNSAPAITNEFLWAQAGESGKLALSWLGTDVTGQPDDFPSWYAAPEAATAVKWWGYLGVISAAATKKPTIAQQRFTEKPMHYGQICNQGIGCTVSNGDRTMADYFGFNLDPGGAIRIVYNDTTSQHHGAHLFELRQLSGKSILGSNVLATPSRNPVTDESADAQWPHYGPTGRRREPAAARLHAARGRPAEPGHAAGAHVAREPRARSCRRRGRPSAYWLTRFQALSTGDHGEEGYRIFYVGAQSTGRADASSSPARRPAPSRRPARARS